MQQDVRRSSDQTEGAARTEPEPAPKPGFARSLFRLGSKRDKVPAPVEPARLTNRLKEVLERDRALIASEPPARQVEELAHDEVEMHEEDVWPDPFGDADPELHTGTHAAPAHEEHDDLPDEVWPHEAASWRGHALDEPFDIPAETGTRPSERGVLQLTEARESADLRLSQIASWIEEEITELPDGAGPLALEAPLDEYEAAELDAVLATDDRHAEPPTQSVPQIVLAPASAPVAPKRAKAERAVEPPRAVEPSRVETPGARPGPSSRAQVKAKVSARPAPRDDAPAAANTSSATAPSKEPINTLTMARLLAMQGYKPRALAVYRELLKRSPGDEALRAEFEALKKAE